MADSDPGKLHLTEQSPRNDRIASTAHRTVHLLRQASMALPTEKPRPYRKVLNASHTYCILFGESFRTFSFGHLRAFLAPEEIDPAGAALVHYVARFGLSAAGQTCRAMRQFCEWAIATGESPGLFEARARQLTEKQDHWTETFERYRAHLELQYLNQHDLVGPAERGLQALRVAGLPVPIFTVSTTLPNADAARPFSIGLRLSATQPFQATLKGLDDLTAALRRVDERTALTLIRRLSADPRKRNFLSLPQLTDALNRLQQD